jgi:hypothetical protein
LKIVDRQVKSDDHFELPFIVLDFIKEFGKQPQSFLTELRTSIVGRYLRERPSAAHLCAPVCILDEVLHYSTENIGIPSELREFLLNMDKWHFQDRFMHYLSQRENDIVVIETQKLFGDGIFDSSLVRFAVYNFLRLNRTFSRFL